MADDTAGAMKMLGLEHCCIFGASQGGMIAQCIAVKYPDLVSKLALGSSCCRMNELFENTVRQWGSLALKRDSHALNHDFVYRVYSEKRLKNSAIILSLSHRIAQIQNFNALSVWIWQVSALMYITRLKILNAPHSFWVQGGIGLSV